MKGGFLYDLEDSFDMLMEYNVIFIGEEHGSPLSHKAELTILKGLAHRDSKIVLALEMFERDVQEVLDDYLAGKISEKKFLQQSRPWPNYSKDYRPLIEFSKKNNIIVVAANLPRRVAALVSKTNRIPRKLLGEDKVYLPPKIHLRSKRYYQKFIESINRMPSFSPMKRIHQEGLYLAQVLKDAVMAASLEPFLDHRVLFCCGHFHSDEHLGIPYQLRKNHPQLNIAVIAMASTIEKLPMKDRSKIADFIWVEE